MHRYFYLSKTGKQKRKKCIIVIVVVYLKSKKLMKKISFTKDWGLFFWQQVKYQSIDIFIPFTSGDPEVRPRG